MTSKKPIFINMRDKISAIIIDKDFLYHDYSGVKTNDENAYSERHFNLKILDTSDGILHEIYRFRGVDAIVTIGDRSIWGDLLHMPFEYRKKWTHLDVFDAEAIASNIIATFLGNIEREDKMVSFSFFTCTYNSSREKLERLYNSMKAQTYNEWNWYIIDDSVDNRTTDILDSFEDPRITIIKNHSIHGNIGFNKHVVAMAADGDFLCEVDHDDELTNDCLEQLLAAYERFPDTDFMYSNALELKGPEKTPILYGKGWGWGEGLTKTEVVNGKKYTFSESPAVNPFSIRTIYAQPNHIRCWRRDFYRNIGGHNPEMSVLDDQELIIRTFLYGKITKVEKVLYIQYEGEGERGVSKDNTQSVRFSEIQRTTMLLKQRFDKEIHNRILELGMKDEAWDEKSGESALWKDHVAGKNIMNNTYIPEK